MQIKTHAFQSTIKPFVALRRFIFNEKNIRKIYSHRFCIEGLWIDWIYIAKWNVTDYNISSKCKSYWIRWHWRNEKKEDKTKEILTTKNDNKIA